MKMEIVPDPVAGTGGSSNGPASPVGTPDWSEEQLKWAARVAWAHAEGCATTAHWQTVDVRDLRGITDLDVVAARIVDHLGLTVRDDGRLQPVVTVLDPHIEILNEQLVGYAGYLQTDGSVLGDPRHLLQTSLAVQAGWPGGRRTGVRGRLLPSRFDVLPLLLRPAGGPVFAYEMPLDRLPEVELAHPRFPWLAALGLRAAAIPAQTRYRLHCPDGPSYPVVVTGWSWPSETAYWNLSHPDRRDTLRAIATCLGQGGLEGPETTRTDDAAIVLWQAAQRMLGAMPTEVPPGQPHVPAHRQPGHTEPDYRPAGGLIGVPTTMQLIVEPAAGQRR